MTQLLFRNRWFALIWAVLICISISQFFGDGGGQQQMAQAASDIRAKRVEAARAEAAVQQDIEDSQVIRGRTVHSDSEVRNEEASASPSSESADEAY